MSGTAINTIITNITGIGVTSYDPDLVTYRLYNVVVTNCSGIGINTRAIASTLINCYSGGNGGADYNGTAGTITTCFSEDGTRSTTQRNTKKVRNYKTLRMPSTFKKMASFSTFQ